MSFQQGLSGLNAAAKSLDVIGNNIANSSTVGFKGSQAQFADVYANSLNGASGSVAGIGTKVAKIAQQFTQGGIEATNNPLDMAINGAGFFRMELGGVAQYTRNGQFTLDKEGFIVNAQRAKLTGYMAQDGIISAGTPLPIRIDTADLPPRQTREANYKIKLDSNSVEPTLAFDPTNPRSYNHIEPMNVYDSLGNKHVLQTFYVKTAPGTWDIYAANNGVEVTKLAGRESAERAARDPAATDEEIVAAAWEPTRLAIVQAEADNAAATAAADRMPTDTPAQEAARDMAIAAAAAATARTALERTAYDNAISGGSPAVTAVNLARAAVGASSATIADVAAATVPGRKLGTMIFNSSGQLDLASMELQSPPQRLPFSVDLPVYPSTGAVSPFRIDLRYSAQQFAGTDPKNPASRVSEKTQDGYNAGQLVRFSAGKNGEIKGEYNNGQSRTMAQVVLANFANPDGLTPLGNNSWAESVASGQQLVGTPDSGSFGVLESSSIEASNVDLTAELVNMITAQRAYQANAQTIKTQDQVMQTLVNLR